VLSGFSSAANAALQLARGESEKRNQYYVGVEHLFLGLGIIAAGGLREALRSTGVDPAVLDRLREEMLPDEGTPPWGKSLIQTPRLQRVIEAARGICARRRRAMVSPGHLLLATLAEPRSVPLRLCAAMEIDVARLRALVERVQDDDSVAGIGEASAHSGTGNLERYGRDLTWLARMHRLDPLIGREAEIARLALILRKKTQNNALIIGEAGTGKTHLVEGLAQELAFPSLESATSLAGKRIIEIDLNALVAGTTYRGDFEARLEAVLKEARNPDIILFIDEFHLILNAGAASGSQGAAQVLKPYLARGEIRCIGSTTSDEYARFIEGDKAFARRFELMKLREPTAEETFVILKGLAVAYCEHHHVEIEEDALRACVEFASRYLPNRCFPEKSIELLDLACAQASFAGNPAVNRAAVAQVVFQETGIRPFAGGAGEGANGLARRLAEQVIGQPEAIQPVVSILLNGQLGLTRPDRPQGVFLLCGPNGVGKSELVRAVAANVFPGQNSLLQLNMAEYAEPAAVMSLIGAPPAYVGHERGGALTEAVRRNPACVIFLNKIEIAHPEVWRLLRQIFAEGRIMDRMQRVVDFTNTLIFMTSNLGFNRGVRTRLGFVEAEGRAGEYRYEDLQAAAYSAIEKTFDFDFRSRIDEVLVFRPLTPPVLRQIIDSEMKAVHQRAWLRQNRTTLRLDDNAYDAIIEAGYSCECGAHELKGTVERVILRPLGAFLRSHSVPPGSAMAVTVSMGETEFSLEPVHV
jgi:ATP-dependent Clp protease ATP-binding subunit ClpC